MIYQCQVPLGGLPVNLVLVGNKEQGKVVFVRVAPYRGDILDIPATSDGVAAAFGEEGFILSEAQSKWFGDYYWYDTVHDYKNIPLMLKWLQQQNLQEPVGIFGE